MSPTLTLFRSARPPFLILVPVCILLGAAMAAAQGARPEGLHLALALLGGLLAHVAVNVLNEYQDFRSGLDLATRRTPFSGGSGALPGHPEMAGAALRLALAALSGCFLIGVFFAWRLGPAIVPLGLAGVGLILSYTGWINRHPWLCLVAPGLGFGLLMVLGTQFVLAGELLPPSWPAALVPFFLGNNLLLLNQYPDIAADRGVGRNHFPIAFGIPHSNRAYALFLAATAGVIVAGVADGRFPAIALIALLPLPLGLFALHGAQRHGEALGRFPHYLAANVAVTLTTPALLGVALLLG